MATTHVVGMQATVSTSFYGDVLILSAPRDTTSLEENWCRWRVGARPLCLAIRALLTRRISSSLLPLNIEPQMISIHPVLRVMPFNAIPPPKPRKLKKPEPAWAPMADACWGQPCAPEPPQQT